MSTQNHIVGGDTSNRTTYLEKLLQLSQSEGSALRVKLGGFSGWNECLAVFLLHASHMDAAACGLTSIDLLSAVEGIERQSVPQPALRVVPNCLQYLQVLNLQHNALLLSYVEHPWECSLLCSATTAASGYTIDVVRIPEEEPESEPMDIDLTTYSTLNNSSSNNSSGNYSSGNSSNSGSADSFQRFAVSLLVRAVNLRVLDLSYCATSAQQTTVLCQGLVAALTAREAASIKPLERVVVRGLEAFPGAVLDLRRRLFVPTTETMAGVRVIDASGFNFAI